MSEFGVKLRLGAVDRLSGTLQKVSRSMGRLRTATQRASNKFKAFQERTKGLRDRLSKVGSAMKSAGANMTARITAPITAMGVGIIAASSKFEASMNRVKALTRSGGADFDAMREKAKELGATTFFSASQAADGMAFLAQAGFKVNDILKATGPIINLATASGDNFEATADRVSNIMGAFAISADQTSNVTDVLVRGISQTNVNMEQLGETMKFAGPVAKTFGASLEETVAAAGLLGNIGIQGTNAGTALKNAFLALSSPTSKANKLLNAMGVQTADSSGKLFKFSDIMKNLGGRLKELPEKARMEVLKELFGKIGIAGGAALAEFARLGEFDKHIKMMKDTNITTEKMADTMSKGGMGAMKALASAIEGLAIAIGDSGVLEIFTDIVIKITEWTREFSKANPTVFQLAVVLGIVAAAMGPVILVIGTVIALLPGLISLAGFLGITLGALALKAVIIGGLFLALVVAGFFLIKHWDTVKTFIFDMWEKITLWWEKGVAAVKVLWNDFLNFPGQLKQEFQDLPGFFGKLWDHIGLMFSDGLTFLTDQLNSFLDILPDSVKSKLGIDVNTNAEKLKKNQENIVRPNFGEPRPVPQSSVLNVNNKNKSNITVDFKNMPKGTNVETKSTDNSVFNINTGLQGAAF